jgi:ubiquinone/menaquinone biosynthesis C-methylase UbiE
MQSLSTPNWDFLGNGSKIQEARKADPDGRYELLKGYFPWPDNTFDGVMSNWVFLDIGSVEELDAAAMEIYRVMKPRGLFVMLMNNEEYIGKRTSTYQNSEPGKTYNPRDEIIVTYFENGNESIETCIKSFRKPIRFSSAIGIWRPDLNLRYSFRSFGRSIINGLKE